MIRIGFYRELTHGDPEGPSLIDALASAPEPDESAIVSYLSSGLLLVACPGYTDDVISGEKGVAAPHILTDGVYTWPADLPYYLARYHVSLPDEFVKYGRSRNWVAPQES